MESDSAVKGGESSSACLLSELLDALPSNPGPPVVNLAPVSDNSPPREIRAGESSENPPQGGIWEDPPPVRNAVRGYFPSEEEMAALSARHSIPLSLGVDFPHPAESPYWNACCGEEERNKPFQKNIVVAGVRITLYNCRECSVYASRGLVKLRENPCRTYQSCYVCVDCFRRGTLQQ